jgi:Tfp pilus assembly protein PilF
VNDALECIERWLALEPDSLGAWQYRVQLFGRLQIATTLLESYRRILELDPENDAVRLQFADQLIQSRQVQEALEQYQYLLPRLGETPQVLGGVACCLRALDKPDEARGLLEKVLAEEPHNALALAERGRIAMEYESPAEAEKWLRRAVAEGPAEHDLLYSLFQALQKMGKQKEAAEIQAKFKAIESDLIELREAILQIGATPHDAEARCQAGLILLRNGKDKDGLRWLASALREDPRHAATHRALADYYERSGDSKQAALHRVFAP